MPYRSYMEATRPADGMPAYYHAGMSRAVAERLLLSQGTPECACGGHPGASGAAERALLSLTSLWRSARRAVSDPRQQRRRSLRADSIMRGDTLALQVQP